VDQPWARLAGPGEGPEHLVQGHDLPSPALARQARRLVEGQDVGVLVEDQGPDKVDLFRAEGDGSKGFHRAI
jgi:hypothetical protein